MRSKKSPCFPRALLLLSILSNNQNGVYAVDGVVYLEPFFIGLQLSHSVFLTKSHFIMANLFVQKLTVLPMIPHIMHYRPSRERAPQEA